MVPPLPSPRSLVSISHSSLIGCQGRGEKGESCSCKCCQKGEKAATRRSRRGSCVTELSVGNFWRVISLSHCCYVSPPFTLLALVHLLNRTSTLHIRVVFAFNYLLETPSRTRMSEPLISHSSVVMCWDPGMKYCEENQACVTDQTIFHSF